MSTLFWRHRFDLEFDKKKQPPKIARVKVTPTQMIFLFFVPWYCFFRVCNPACISKLHTNFAWRKRGKGEDKLKSHSWAGATDCCHLPGPSLAVISWRLGREGSEPSSAVGTLMQKTDYQNIYLLKEKHREPFIALIHKPYHFLPIPSGGGEACEPEGSHHTTQQRFNSRVLWGEGWDYGTLFCLQNGVGTSIINHRD